MALALPYPDITFVPLDVLTAEELNQIQTNITALSDVFPVNTSNIANSAITAQKIAPSAVGASQLNWMDVFPTFLSRTSSTTSITQSYKDLLYIDVSSLPIGAKFYVSGHVRYEMDGQSSVVTTQLKYGSEASYAYANEASWSASSSSDWIYTRSASATRVYLQGIKDNTNPVSAAWAHMVAFRCG